MVEKQENIFAKYKRELKEASGDLKDPKRRYRQIPNILTFLRLTAPLFIIPSAIFGSLPLTLGLIAGFGLTDFADGFIARKYNLTSDLGRDLDAICDKVFALTLLLAASVANPILLTSVLLESVIAGINTVKKINGQDPKSTMTGKVKTWFLFSLIGAALLSSFEPINEIFNVLLPTTAIMQILTISSYIKDNQKKENKKDSLPNTNQSIELNIQEDDNSKEKVLESKQEDLSLDELKSLKEYITGEEEPIKEKKAKKKIKTLDSK